MPAYQPLSWVKIANVANAQAWNIQRPLRGTLGGLVLTEAGAPLITEDQGQLGDTIAAAETWIQALKPSPPNWTIQTAALGEGSELILTEAGAPLIAEGTQVGGTPGVVGPPKSTLPVNVLLSDLLDPLTTDSGDFLISL